MDIIFNCCHCKNDFIVNTKDFNCKILRHGYYKKDFTQINPHLSKEQCLKLIEDNLIYGCGKPLRIIEINEKNSVEICDYI